MADFILLMHDDAPVAADDAMWETYLTMLRGTGLFQGGSSIGAGAAFRKAGEPAPITAGVGGYIRVEAADLDAAAALLKGNPVYEAGGTVEIRELPRD